MTKDGFAAAILLIAVAHSPASNLRRRAAVDAEMVADPRAPSPS